MIWACRGFVRRRRGRRKIKGELIKEETLIKIEKKEEEEEEEGDQGVKRESVGAIVKTEAIIKEEVEFEVKVKKEEED